MSPKQARGHVLRQSVRISGRSVCVLFEMITGRMCVLRLRRSQTRSSRVLKAIRRTGLRCRRRRRRRLCCGMCSLRCLEKGSEAPPGETSVTYGIVLDDAEAWRRLTDSASPKPSRAGERVAWALLVALTAAAAAVVTAMVAQGAFASAEIRFNQCISPSALSLDFAQLAISPDGQQIVVAPGVGGQQRTALWLRPLASTSGRLLTGTEGASLPFWSPDGRSIGFFADQKLKRLDVNSEAIQGRRGCPQRTRRRLAGRRYDSVRAKRRRSAIQSGAAVAS